jgi:hypothetical protein
LSLLGDFRWALGGLILWTMFGLGLMVFGFLFFWGFALFMREPTLLAVLTIPLGLFVLFLILRAIWRMAREKRQDADRR